MHRNRVWCCTQLDYWFRWYFCWQRWLPDLYCHRIIMCCIGDAKHSTLDVCWSAICFLQLIRYSALKLADSRAFRSVSLPNWFLFFFHLLSGCGIAECATHLNHRLLAVGTVVISHNERPDQNRNRRNDIIFFILLSFRYRHSSPFVHLVRLINYVFAWRECWRVAAFDDEQKIWNTPFEHDTFCVHVYEVVSLSWRWNWFFTTIDTNGPCCVGHKTYKSNARWTVIINSMQWIENWIEIIFSMRLKKFFGFYIIFKLNN